MLKITLELNVIYPLYPDPFLSVTMLDDQRHVESMEYTQRLLADVLRTNKISDIPELEPVSVNDPFLQWACNSMGSADWVTCYFAACLGREMVKSGKTPAASKYLKPFVEGRAQLPQQAFTLYPNVTTYPNKPIHIAYRLWLVDQWRNEKPQWYGAAHKFRVWSELEGMLAESIKFQAIRLNKFITSFGLDDFLKVQMIDLSEEDNAE